MCLKLTMLRFFKRMKKKTKENSMMKAQMKMMKQPIRRTNRRKTSLSRVLKKNVNQWERS